MGIKKFDGISEDLGINESNYFMYDGWGQCAPPPLRAPASQPGLGGARQDGVTRLH
tara:strand:+ start:1535 stop:1702 length:168 start_codon:yes stop_codon:yes gene_type:complete